MKQQQGEASVAELLNKGDLAGALTSSASAGKKALAEDNSSLQVMQDAALIARACGDILLERIALVAVVQLKKGAMRSPA